MIDPVTGMALVSGGTKLLGGLTDLLGSSGEAEAKEKALARARGSLTAGYGKARGYQSPIYDTSLGTFQDLTQSEASGAFDLNPDEVFKDPEYQAQLRAGRDAIEGGAASQGMLFSGTTGRDLTKYGSDLFASRGDELQKRLGDKFQRGMQLTENLLPTAGNLSDLSSQEGTALSNLDLDLGDIQGGAARNKMTGLGNIVSDLGGVAGEYMLGKGKPKKPAVVV